MLRLTKGFHALTPLSSEPQAAQRQEKEQIKQRLLELDRTGVTGIATLNPQPPPSTPIPKPSILNPQHSNPQA